MFPDRLEELGRQGYTPASSEEFSVRTGKNPDFIEKTYFDSSNEDYESSFELFRHFPESDTLILAPHAGHMEKFTGKQAYQISRKSDISAWIFAGFKGGLDASKKGWRDSWDYWHDESHLIEPEDYRHLHEAEKQDYNRSVSFHCFRNPEVEADIILGGRGKYLKKELHEALSESYDVQIADSRELRYHGQSQNNLVNRTASQGVQIEQDWKILKENWQDIGKKVERKL